MSTATSQQSLSVWLADRPNFPDLGPLRDDTVADVCVVGGGVAGLTTAYLLALEKKNVVVLEAGELAHGETGRTTAHLASALDEGFLELERLHGRTGAARAAQSHARAIDTIESIIKAEQIACDFERVNGYLFLATGQSVDLLEREREAATRAGLAGIDQLPRAPLPAFETGPCLLFPNQAQFHPLRYMAGLATALRHQGGRIFIHSPVKSFTSASGRAWATTGDGRTVQANHLVVATNTPVNDRVTIHTKQAAYRTYALAFRIPAGLVPSALYWDTADPYHYVRTQRLNATEMVLIVGGEDHKTGQTTDERACFTRLHAWTQARIPQARDVVAQWSGQVMEPVDGLAFIGRNPGDEPNVFIATGDSGHGMTHGTIAGLLITDLISGRENPWATLYDPARKTLWSTGEYLRENLNTAAQYLDWLSRGEVSSAEDIKAGEGAILRQGLRKLALYKDESGQVHRLSAFCPHLGGLVRWNTAEKTWDCPCHGSRFDAKGQVLNGPSLSNLERKDAEQ